MGKLTSCMSSRSLAEQTGSKAKGIYREFSCRSDYGWLLNVATGNDDGLLFV